MGIKAIIEGKEVELKADDLKLGDGFALITPDKVPEGYYNEAAVQKRISDRVKNTATNAREEALKDKEFHKRIFSDYNITLDEEGNPQGLKPDVDVEEMKKSLTKEISGQYETKLSEYEKKLSGRDAAVVKSTILSAGNGQVREEWTKSFDGGDALVIKKMAERI